MLGTGRKVGRMFKVHDLKIPSQVVFAAATTITILLLELWHANLQLLASQGHLGSI